MHRTVMIVITVLALLAGCKKKGEVDETGVVIAKMGEFRDAMCRCADKACADAVQESLTKWSHEMAAKASNSARTRRPSEADIKEMTEVGQKYAECMTKAMTPTPEPVAVDSPVPTPTDEPRRPAPAPVDATIDQLLALARTWAAGEKLPLTIVKLEVFYVDADGKVDDADGELTIELGAMPRGDKPKRRIGAPVKDTTEAATCMTLHWTRKDGWWTTETTSLARCPEATPPFPRCTIPEVWKRAIAKGAPSDAVAVVRLADATQRIWKFSITDEPRQIDLNYQIPDSCELAVEKP